jgi:hypothetical protein
MSAAGKAKAITMVWSFIFVSWRKVICEQVNIQITGSKSNQCSGNLLVARIILIDKYLSINFSRGIVSIYAYYAGMLDINQQSGPKELCHSFRI